MNILGEFVWSDGYEDTLALLAADFITSNRRSFFKAHFDVVNFKDISGLGIPQCALKLKEIIN